MSMLIKSVWRGVVRAAPAARGSLPPAAPGVPQPPHAPAARSRCYAHTAAVVPEPRAPDAAMASIKSASTPEAVLDAVQAFLPQLTHAHMLQALRTLFLLSKTDSDLPKTESLIKDPAFSVLCQNFKKHARALDVNEAIEATKFLSYLGVPIDSFITQTMLQLIRTQINYLNVRQIMFLDFILSRFDGKSYLVDALQLALPLAFQIHLPTEVDCHDPVLLKDMLFYSCTHDLPDRCINNVVTGLLLLDQKIDASIAKSVIWSLCQVNCTEEYFPTRVQLLHICYDILTQKIDCLSYEDVLRTAAKIKGRILEKHPEYYHEQLMDAIASYVVRHGVEFEKALLVARVLSRIAHTHLGLIESLCQQAVAKPNTLANARTNILFGFVNCLANNNYVPDHETWQNLRSQISRNRVLDGRNSALPWAKFCLELASLGHFEDKLLSRVFSNEFLENYLSRDNNVLDYLQLYTLHEAVHTFYSQEYKLPPDFLAKAREMYPTHALTSQLEESLVRGLGSPNFCAKNVVMPNGFVADILVCLKNGYPLELRAPVDVHRLPFSSLKLPPGTLPVCLLNFNQGCFSMNSNRLRGTFRLVLDIMEKQGYAAVPINITEWLTAPPHERTPYLLREIGYKCGEIGIKLSIT